MSRDAKKNLIERLHSLWSTGDLSIIPEIYSPTFVAHMPKGWEQSEFTGHSGVCEAIERIRAAFSDWTETIEDMIIEDDKVVTRYVSTGLHVGPFIGLAPTAKPIRLDEISIYRLNNGFVAEQWCLTDDISLARQLGRF
jgi:predicted ester cyclase